MKKDIIFSTCESIGYQPYQSSLREKDGNVYLIAERAFERVLLIFGSLPAPFSGKNVLSGEQNVYLCELTPHNASAIRFLFPYTAPVTPEGHKITIGLGDRLGIFTEAHIQAIKNTGVFPVLAQQSKRELSLTGRSNRSLLDNVTWQVFAAGYEGGYAADGDHLKTLEEVKDAIADGDTMITLDCSNYIDNTASSLCYADALRKCRELIAPALLDSWNETYAEKTVAIGDHDEITFSKEELAAIYLTYHAAFPFIEKVYQEAIACSKAPVALEISIDETEIETTPTAHYFVATELLKRNIKFCSMAPRFCGEFQKGIDYIGDISRFRIEFAVHANIAKKLGYRISVHSGSDKFSVFPYIGSLSDECFHLKTSGTSWVEAVRVIARYNPDLFRRMFAFSCANYQAAREYYHVSAEVENIPSISSIPDEELPHLLDEKNARQVMHITYGFLLQAKEHDAFIFRNDIYQTLLTHKIAANNLISEHIKKHLRFLGIAEGP